MRYIFFALLFISVVSKGQDAKISELPSATSLVGNEVVPVVQSGTTKKATVNLFRNGYVPITRTLTINGVGYDLSTNRSWTIVGGVTSFSFTNANGFTGLVSNSTTTPALSLTLQNASGSQSGQLTSTDWTTFNNKQSAITFGTGVQTALGVNIGTAGSFTVNGGVLGTPSSGDFSSGTFAWPTFNQNTTGSAATLTTPRTIQGVSFDGSANINIINGTGFVKASGTTLSYDNSTYLTGNQTITLSGDVSGSGSTAITTAIGSGKVTNTMLAGSIAASKLVGTDIATVGTITSGTWNGTIVGKAYGGTGEDNSTGGTANTFWSRPNGATGAASYRAIVAADIPTLNQNTTGSAATLTTPRAIYGNNFDGSAALTQIIASTYGGTGNGFTKFSGATTSEKTYTLPNASSTILTDNTSVTVAQGGTGNTTFTAYSIIAAGTTSTGAFQNVSGVGTSGQVLTSNGAGALPTWQAAAGGISGSGTANQLTYWTGSSAIGGISNVTVSSGVITVDGDNASNSTVTSGLKLTHTTSGTPATGIGTGLQFETETSNSNNEIGATIEAVTTDVTSTSEDFDLAFKNMAAGATATEQLRLTSDGRLYGKSLHNNSGAVTGTSNQYIASGTYTPTLTNVTNVAASTAYTCQWIRVGNVVTVSGMVDIDATTGSSTATELGMSLPIASSLSASEQVGGVGSSNAAANLAIRFTADATNDRVSVVYKCSSTSNDTYSFSFTYLVL